jgi:predicted nucleic-acid-binding Zn-ribbon protein
MDITGFRMWCKGCGYEEKYEPQAWHEKAQKLTPEQWPKHCGVSMGFSRHIKCKMCGYEEDQELPLA